MDSIVLDKPFDRNEFFKSNKLYWDLTWKDHKKRLINFSIATILILIPGLFLISESEPTNPYLFIGCTLFIFTMLMVVVMIYSLKSYNKLVKMIADKFEELNANYRFELSESAVKYWDYEKHYEYKWSAFTHYTIYKDHIVLFTNSSPTGAFMFSKEFDQDEKYNLILELVKTKLEYKKI